MSPAPESPGCWEGIISCPRSDCVCPPRGPPRARRVAPAGSSGGRGRRPGTGPGPSGFRRRSQSHGPITSARPPQAGRVRQIQLGTASPGPMGRVGADVANGLSLDADVSKGGPPARDPITGREGGQPGGLSLRNPTIRLRADSPLSQPRSKSCQRVRAWIPLPAPFPRAPPEGSKRREVSVVSR